MGKEGIESWLLNVIREVYDGTKSCMRMNGMLNKLIQYIEQCIDDFFMVFNVFMEKDLRNACSDDRSAYLGMCVYI